MKKPIKTTEQVLQATAKHLGIHPDRIREFKKLGVGDYIAGVPRACTITLGLSKALGNSTDEILETVQRKHHSSVSHAHEKLEWNVKVSSSWKNDVEAILQAL